MSEENKTNADGAMEDEIYRLMEDLELSLGEDRPGHDAFDPFGPDDGPAMMEGYGIWCEVDEDLSEHTVGTMTRSFQPSENQYVHVDLELPSEEEGTLLVEIAVDTASGQVEALFDPQTTALFRDGRRLHVAPIRLTRLLGDDYELAPGLTGTLVVTLYRDGGWVGEHKVVIQGPWPFCSGKGIHSGCQKVAGMQA